MADPASWIMAATAVFNVGRSVYESGSFDEDFQGKNVVVRYDPEIEYDSTSGKSSLTTRCVEGTIAGKLEHPYGILVDGATQYYERVVERAIQNERVTVPGIRLHETDRRNGSPLPHCRSH